MQDASQCTGGWCPGLPYHITQRGTNRQRVFFTAADRSLYLRLIRENQAEAGVRILAYCLMTNHVHFVAIPEREDSLAVLFGRANGRYAQAINIRKGRSGHFWQNRFHSCALSESHLEIALRYVEDNPCRAGLVTTPGQYRWSSAAAHLAGEPDRSHVLDVGFGSGPAGRRPGRECTQAGRARIRSWRFENARTRGGRGGNEGQPEQPRSKVTVQSVPERILRVPAQI